MERKEFVSYLWQTWEKDQACDLTKEHKTQYDTEQIVKLRNLLEHLPQTTGYLEDRTQLLRDIYNSLIVGSPKKERIAIVLCGPPASRKSNVANSIVSKVGARIIDSDIIKEQLPEFNEGKFAQMVHEESDKVRNMILREALTKGENLILPIVGKSHGSVLKIFNVLVKAKYEVHLRLITCDSNVSAERVVARFGTSGRFVDPLYALNVADLPSNVFDDLLNLPWKSTRQLSQDQVDDYLEESGF